MFTHVSLELCGFVGFWHAKRDGAHPRTVGVAADPAAVFGAASAATARVDFINKQMDYYKAEIANILLLSGDVQQHAQKLFESLGKAQESVGKSTATALALRNGMPMSSVGVLLQGDFQKNLKDSFRVADAADAVQVSSVLFDLLQARGIRLQILFDNTFDRGLHGQQELLLGLTRYAFECGLHLLVVTQSEKAVQEAANLNGARSRAWAQNDARSYRWERMEARKHVQNNPLRSNEQIIDAVLNMTQVPDQIGRRRPVDVDEYLCTGRRPQAPQAGQGSQFKFRMAHMVAKCATSEPVVWLRGLARKDKQLTDGEEFEPTGNAFQVKGAFANVALCLELARGFMSGVVCRRAMTKIVVLRVAVKSGNQSGRGTVQNPLFIAAGNRPFLASTSSVQDQHLHPAGQ
ncbi:unnamed protein product [Symbiodinium sp. CCMP2592]|nr:unnamed protein product [Symbiodinium sp. CCMP2592]